MKSSVKLRYFSHRRWLFQHDSELAFLSGARSKMKSRSKNLQVGDKVKWNTSRGLTVGVVKKKLTAGTKVKTHKVAASKKSPEYLVESSKTGKKAAHKPNALKKVR
jgi:hypothetical protein